MLPLPWDISAPALSPDFFPTALAPAFATSGMALAAVSFLLLMLLPANFAYGLFALVIFLNGIAFGLFASPIPPRS